MKYKHQNYQKLLKNSTKKDQLDLLLSTKLKQFGLPDYEILDFKQGISKEICPYKCLRCEGIFKGLIEWVVHNRITRTTNKCPTPGQLIKHSLRKDKIKANGFDYVGWISVPAIQEQGIKDEVLLDLYQKLFPDFNQLKKG